MTNYNERLNEVLQQLCNTVYQHGKATRTNTPFHYGEPMKEAKQAITSLIKELVAEAKPQERIDVYTYSNAKTNGDIRKFALDEFEQNLLKALEEV